MSGRTVEGRSPRFKLQQKTVTVSRPPNVDISAREALHDVMDRG